MSSAIDAALTRKKPQRGLLYQRCLETVLIDPIFVNTLADLNNQIILKALFTIYLLG